MFTFGNAADDRRIVRHVLQPDLRRAVDAEVRRIGEVVAAREAEAEVADQGRRERPRQAERQPLRAIVVRSERVVERSLARPGSGAGRNVLVSTKL